MYNVAHYSAMIEDAARVDAYHRALQMSVKPGAVVVDIGTGLGLFAFLACQAGARKVYAIEPSSVIALAERMAAANGFLDRIEFFPDISTRVTLPEQADVIVSDLSGAVPLFQQHLPSIADARRRFLKPGGTLIPQGDVLWAAVVDAPEIHQKMAPAVDRVFGLDMGMAWRTATNISSNRTFTRDQLVTSPQRFATLDYATIEEPNCSAAITWNVTRSSRAHGIDLWFERTLADGVSFSTQPGPKRWIYGSLFLPWPEPVSLQETHTIHADIRADLASGDYIWTWNTRILKGTELEYSFRQSDFLGDPYSADNLRKQATHHVPSLNDEGRMERLILECMNGESSVEEIASQLHHEFPSHFSTSRECISRVGQISRKYSL